VIFVCAIKTMELGDEAAVAMRLQVSKVSGGWDTLGGRRRVGASLLGGETVAFY
jgi:hypothetical protein